jgi:hypothetical protein
MTDVLPPDESRPPSRLFPWSAWLAAVWLAAGALFKLRMGTPGDLPPIVRDFPLDDGWTFRLAIAIELAIVAAAFLKPRWGWPLLVAIYVVFLGVLSTQFGDDSCGCFGGNIEIAPWVMALVDGALLVTLLASRPWRATGPAGVKPWILAVAVAAVAALPFVFDREGKATPDPSGEEPSSTRGYVVLDLESWAGKDIWDTPLAEWTDMSGLAFFDGLWVFYRHTCDHCAEHLAAMVSTEVGQRFVTLVRLVEPHDNEANRVVFEMPDGEFVQRLELPDTVDWVISTPGELLLENGRVLKGHDGFELEDGY